MRWAWHVARLGVIRMYTKFWSEKPAGKRKLERPRCRWEDNVRMDLNEIGW
jgi:hypothetical protein